MDALSNIPIIGTLSPIVLIALVVLVTLFLFKRPIKFIFRLLFNTLLGFVILFALNFFGASLGITLGINLFNAVVVAILGLPGVGLLLILQWLSII